MATLDDRLDQLGEIVVTIFHSMSRLVRSSGACGDVTPQQVHLLAQLAQEGPRTVGELRDFTNAAQSTTSEMVGRLAKAGLVHKRPAPGDSRSVRVAITPRGRSVLDGHKRAMRERHRAVLERLCPADQDKLLAAFQTVSELVVQAAETHPEGPASVDDEGGEVR